MLRSFGVKRNNSQIFNGKNNNYINFKTKDLNLFQNITKQKRFIITSTNLSDQVRVRFAPSPTGYLHLGGFRTALYNYLFAKKHEGQFILRIEDTDRSRLVDDSVKQINHTLNWAGIKYDEGPDVGGKYGPYIQSQRTDLYQKYVDQLIDQGKAYRCFCSSERLARIRDEGQRRGLPTIYDRYCLHLSDKEVEERLRNNESYTVRMKIPEGTTVFEDQVRGRIIINHKDIDDQILLKSDGFPTYHLANVVDDHLMQISNVIRGEEWIPSTPKHIILYKMFNWKIPQFAHLPLLLDSDRSKLSKRHGHAAMSWYQEEGYLPDSVTNFAAFLGWNPPSEDREILTLEELTKQFSLERINKGGATVNLKKLQWINSQHIARQCEDENTLQNLIELSRVYIDREYPNQNFSDDYIGKVLKTLKGRLHQIYEIVELNDYFFEEPKYDNPDVKKFKIDVSDMKPVIQDLLQKFQELSAEEFTASNLSNIINRVVEDHSYQYKFKDVALLLRYMVTAKRMGASMGETMETIGKDRCIQRIRYVYEQKT